MMARFQEIRKEKKKVQLQTSVIKDALQSAKESKAKANLQSDKLRSRIQKKKDKLDEVKAKREAGKDFWSLMGLQVIPLEAASLGKSSSDMLGGDHLDINMEGKPSVVEGNFAFEFSKLDPQNLNRKFTVKVNFATDSVKIYETDPEDLFSLNDLDDIERRASTDKNGLLSNNNSDNNTGLGPKKTFQDPIIDARLLAILLRHHIQSKFK